MVVDARREDLALLGGDGRVARMSVVNTPPPVSTPSESGVTSSSSTSTLSSPSAAPCSAAPAATTSSGFTPLCGSLPKNCFTAFCTAGMRVMPPTRMTLWMSAGVSFASASAFWQGSSVRSTRSLVRSSSSERVQRLDDVERLARPRSAR